jgi:probable blue pigment (indigoidine) exporter
LIGNAAFAVLGREVQRGQLTDTLTLTAIPLGVAGIMLLPLALLIEGLPKAPPAIWAIILSLAGLNTAAVYALMNHELKVLAALEMSVMVNLTPLLTGLWSWLLLSEKLRMVQIVGIIVEILGVIVAERGKSNMQVY